MLRPGIERRSTHRVQAYAKKRVEPSGWETHEVSSHIDLSSFRM